MFSNNSSICPTCGSKCKEQDSICLADGPEDILNASSDEHEFKIRIWSYMKPPKISNTPPSITTGRLERVRQSLEGNNYNDRDLKTVVQKKISLLYMADGSVRKVKSKTETRQYPPNTIDIERCNEDGFNTSASASQSNISYDIREICSSTKRDD